MSRTSVAGIVGAVALITIGLVWYTVHGRYDPAASYEDKIAYWVKRIHTVGDKPAYEEMVAAQEGSAAGVEHIEAHIFGTALYRAEGIRGVSVCDDRFSYACYHQLIGEAIADLGTESLDTIIAACNGAPGCRHGIGHGVIGAMGYTFDGLQKSLSICSTLPTTVDVQGCYGGVFMEYNIRRLLGLGQERPMGEDWFDACTRVSASAVRVCYFWQPTWWGHALKSPDETLSQSTLSAMGDKCREVQDRKLRAVCFEGIGVSALNTGHALSDGVSACAHVSSDMHEQALCRTSVARYIALVQGSDQGRAVCTGLTGVYQERCTIDALHADPETSYIGEVLESEKGI